MPWLLRVPCWRVVVGAILVAGLAPGMARAECLPATPTEPDGNYILPGTRGGIVYRRIDGRTLALDAWTPGRADGRPAVIVIHGGGFTTGSRVAFVGQLLEMLGGAGVPSFSIDYRLNEPADRNAALDDLRAAVAFVRCRAAELGIDANRLLLLGEDSGAQMALDLIDDAPDGIIGAILVGGMYSSPAMADRDGDTIGKRLQPDCVACVRPRGPRLLFVHGSADDEQPIEAVRTACEQRRRTSASCDLVAVDGGIHRAENWRPEQWGYKRQVIDWLARLAGRSRNGGSEVGLPAQSLGEGRRAPGLHKRITWDAEHALTFDAWLPRSAVPTPAVVLVHGGGWEAGDRVTYIAPLFAPLARAGLAWISLDYRLTPAVRHPAQLDDLRRALAYVRAHAPQLNIDPARLVLVGESASGQMAMLLAGEDRGIAGVVSFYGVYDFAPLVTDASPRSLAARLFGRHALDEQTRALLRRYSPLHQAHADMPPILLIHGTNERLWPQGVAMAERLQSLRVPHELIRLEGAPHGMENWEGHAGWAAYKERLIEWIVNRNPELGMRNEH